ncbi:MAG: histidine--tRNA ligase [Flavobacteriaceae bacterium]|nr:histidine--tRNA ligase [Flavobacteriaceae bacterium]
MKPSIPKGTRDFSPTEVAKRNYIFDTIKKSFENYGFQPIETPAFENSSTLMGKYGEEGDRLIFKILNSGDYFKDVGSKLVSSGKMSVTFFEIIRSLKIRKHIVKEKFLSEYNIFVSKLVQSYPSKKYNINEKKIIEDFFKNNKEKIIKILNENINENSYESADDINVTFFRDLFVRFYEEYLNELDLLNSKKTTSLISEKALRYDLTVPFARYVVQHQNEIVFPFKRYQMQPVWRADRPQKGRFREFYQCDADIVGSTSLWQEVEFVQLYDDVFTKLGLTDTIIKINNRKILSGIAEMIGAQDKLIDFTVALDKIDKIGVEGITKEMLGKGIAQDAIEKLNPLFNLKGTNKEKLSQLKGMLKNSDEGSQGVDDLQFLIENVTKLGLQSSNVQLDVTLARGLNYYTGAIFEVVTDKVNIGSIGGGGRYDDLTGIFGLKDMSGVGISFGLDRIYLVLEELDLFNEVKLPKPKVVFLNFDKDIELTQLKAIKRLRENNIKCELYPDVAQSNKQQKKQWKYITNRNIEYVVSGVDGDIFTLKNMINGEQKQCSIEELLETVKNL